MFTDLAEKIRDKGKALKEGLFKDRQFQLPDALVNEVLKRNLDKISASAGVEFRGMVLVSGREFFTLEGSIAHRGIAATVSIRVLPSEITWHTNTHVIRFEILEKSCAIQKAGLRGMLAALVMTVVKTLTGKDFFDTKLASLGDGDGSMAFSLDGVSQELDLALRVLHLKKIEPGNGGIMVTGAVGTGGTKNICESFLENFCATQEKITQSK